MEIDKIIKLLEGYEMPCGSGEYDFIHRKDYQAIAKELQQAMNYIPCCTEFICHSCNEKKSGQNDDQLHEVCKECFGGI